MGAIIDKTYLGCGHDHSTNWDKLKLYWLKTIGLSANYKNTAALFNEVDQLPNGGVSNRLFNHTDSHLNSGVTTVFKSVKYGDKDYALVNSLMQNSAEFSAFKSAYFTELIKGKTKEEKQAIMAVYSRQLEVEGSLAVRTSRSAKQWQEFESTKELYPNLEYLPSRSVDKRVEHQSLYGTILPINDPFWDSYMPPNGWNCKCRVRRSDANSTTGETPSVNVPNGIIGNAGKQQKIFSNQHPFIKNVSDKGKAKVKKNLEGFKQNMAYGTTDYKSKKGNTIEVHTYADKTDLEINFNTAKMISDQMANVNIKIRPHSQNTETGIGKNKMSNPEYSINGKYADLKTIYGNSIKSAYKSAKKQGCESVVFKIEVDMSINKAFDLINGETSRYNTLFDEIFVIKGKKVYMVPKKKA